jgi:hypothetical protein
MADSRWVVLEKADRAGWALCRCLCGTEREVMLKTIKAGKSRSCGCLQREAVTKHGLSKNQVFRVWQEMIRRCYDTKSKGYKNYGARGIKVCLRWRNSFTDFTLDMGPRPDGHSIERKNNDGPYCPDNCVWATRTQQNRNTTRNRVITYNGKTQCLAAWAEELGVSLRYIWQRIKRHGESVLSDMFHDNRKKH